MMLAKINPTGTHIHKGKLKVRVDLYPDINNKTYNSQHIDKFDREPTKEELADEELLSKISTHKETNPCLCHFITIDEDITRPQLKTLIESIFDKGTIDELDDALSKNDRNRVSRVMRAKCGNGKVPLKQVNLNDLNVRFKNLEVRVGTD